MYYSIASWIYNGPTSISYGSQQAVSVGDVIQGSITASATGVSVETKVRPAKFETCLTSKEPL